MSADLTSFDIVSKYFDNENKVKDLTGDLAAANSQIEALKWYKTQHDEREERNFHEYMENGMFDPGTAFNPDDNGVANL